MKAFKKFIAVLLTVMLISSLGVSVFAEIHETNLKTESGKWFVIKTAPAANVFDMDGGANGTFFKWGLGAFLEPYDEGVKIKANTNGELSVGYGSAGTIGFETVPGTFVPGDLKFFAMRYKSEGSSTVGVKFMTPGTDANWDAWSDPQYQAMFDFEASADYAIVCGELPEAMQFDDVPFLIGWECTAAEADVFVTDICFFASEEDAKYYQDNYEELNKAPETTEAITTEAEVTTAEDTAKTETTTKTQTTTKADVTTSAETIAENAEEETEGLSTGALIGIIAAIVVVVCAVVIIVTKKKK